MKLYLSSKIVFAEPMDEKTFIETIKKQPYNEMEQPNRQGYHVVYPGDYHSWSPKEAFDNSHRELTTNEIIMLNN